MENQNTITIETAKYKMLLGKALQIKADPEIGNPINEVVGNRFRDLGGHMMTYGEEQTRMDEYLFEAELLVEFIRLHQ